MHSKVPVSTNTSRDILPGAKSLRKKASTMNIKEEQDDPNNADQ